MDSVKDDNEQRLLEKYRNTGDKKLIGKLYSKYADLVYGLCLKYLKDRESSQDAVMSIFEKLIVKLRTEQIDYFKSWLYMVSKNHCLMELRKSNRMVNTQVMEIPVTVHLNDGIAQLEEDLEALEDCIKRLESRQEQCIRLFFLEKRSYGEIHNQTGYELKSVKSFIQNGKRNLKICMEERSDR